MIGRVLDHYRIEEQIGAGGMGIVYRAFDTELHRRVAIKVLADAPTGEIARERLLLEARAASGLNHPNVCTIYAVAHAADHPYIVMELVEGRTLAETLAADRLRIETGIRYGIQIADALAHAHQHGVVHRDLKSANIMVLPGGRLKVLDFGLARQPLQGELQDLTRSQTLSHGGTVSGTLAYMAPEILRGRPADERSDIWALGVVLYEMASGAPPFTGQTGFELSAAILREPAAPLPAEAPPGVAAVVRRCLNKDPSERYQQASEVRAALETCVVEQETEGRRCPQCRAPVSGGGSFCPACGARLSVECTACGTANRPGHHFCVQCGHPLQTPATAPADPAAPVLDSTSPQSYIPKHLADRILKTRSGLEGERKQVTVLFCQLANADAVGERLGSDVMHELLGRFFDLALEDVHRYEGTVNQFLGDGFLALFGAPLTHEDDARRAVLAALAIHRRVQESSAALALRPGSGQANGDSFELATRIGLNTGPVLVGRIADNLRMDYTAIGETTHLATLLGQVAEPGAILMTESTRRLVQEDVATEPIELAVRTKTGPVVGHRLVGLAPAASRLESRLKRRAARFVGRERELATLRDLLARAEGGEGQVAGIVGEPGMGKSRLLYEFRQATSASEIAFLEGRCISYGASSPYLPLLDILRAHCRISETDPPDVMVGKVAECLHGKALGLRPDDHLPYLLHLLALNDADAENEAVLSGLGPEAIKARTFEALRQLTLQASQRRPIVVLVEDLHWIDRTSEEYLTSLVERLVAARVLLLVTYRPGYRPPWLDRSYATQITLRPLGQRDSLEVVAGVLETDATAVSTAILSKAEGNPFFLEEMALAVRERGQTDHVIPDTVQGVIMARIDRLPDVTKRLLQTASVLGREIPLELLQRVWEGAQPIEDHLLELRRLEFVYERGAAGEPVYVFKHALTQDVAYDSLLTARRQAVHARAAEALEAMYAGRLDEVCGALAHHYARTDRSEQAVTYLIRAADRAARVYANAEAIEHLREALRHLLRLPDSPARDRRIVDVVLRHGHSLYFVGRFRESVDLLAGHASRVERLRDPAVAGAYLFWLAHMYSRLGDQPRAASHAEEAIKAATRAGDEATLGKAHGLLALEGHWSGKTLEGIRHGETSIGLLENSGQHWWLGMARFYLAFNYFLRGDFDAALREANEADILGKRIEDPRLQTYAGFTMAWTYATRGEPEAAIEIGRRAREQAPDVVSRAYASLMLGGAYLERGDLDTAASLLEPTIIELEGFEFPQWEGLGKVLVGEIHRLKGQFAPAAAAVQAGLDAANRARYAYCIGYGQGALGRLALDEGRLDDAQAQMSAALQTFDDMGAAFEAARARLDLARVALARGDRPGAAALLDVARRTFERLNVPAYVARTEVLARLS